MSTEATQRYSISVGQYGHPQLTGARHWSILVENVAQPTPWTGNTTVYEVTGSTNTYEYKNPYVKDLKQEPTFMGRILVGYVNAQRKETIGDVLSQVPITHGSLNWNCQNWVAAGLDALARAGIQVRTFTQPEMHTMLEDIRA
jgi:hypothetical protein